MHNGTIYNYEELANKYIPDVNIVGMTDSQVMAHIFYYKGYAALGEYQGAGAFVMVDYRKGEPQTFVFKGSSKLTDAAINETEERPLFYCTNPSKKELVFSSIASYLIANRPDDQVYFVPCNCLLEFDGDDLVEVTQYDRSNLVQAKPIVTYNSYYDCYVINNDISYLHNDPAVNKYSVNTKECHGEYYVSKYGVVYKDKFAYANVNKLWFYRGVALKNSTCFKCIKVLQKISKLNDLRFCTKFENIIRFLSYDGLYFKDGKLVKAISPSEYKPFTGDFQALTTSTVRVYKDGNYQSMNYHGGDTLMKLAIAQVDKIPIKELKALCKSLIL